MPISDTIRAYDSAVMAWLVGALRAANPKWHQYNPTSTSSEPAQYAVAFATPERPFARPSTQDGKRGVLTWPSPFASLQRLPMSFDAERWNFNVWPAVTPSTDGKNFLMSRYPPPFRIPYQVDVWCRYQDSGTSSALESIRSMYFMTHPQVVLSINFNQPWGSKRVHLNVSDIIDNSDLEPDERERWIRYTIPMYVDGWMFMDDTTLSDFPDSFGVITQTPIVLNVDSTFASAINYSQDFLISNTHIYVSDSLGNVWQVSVSDNGNLSLTEVSGQMASTYILADYQTQTTAYQLIVDSNQKLNTIAATLTSSLPTYINLYSPSGILWSITVNTQGNVIVSSVVGYNAPVTFTASLNNLPIAVKSVSMTLAGQSSSSPGIITAADDGEGNLVGIGILSGSINYTTGAFNITYAQTLPQGQVISASYNQFLADSDMIVTQSKLGGQTGF